MMNGFEKQELDKHNASLRCENNFDDNIELVYDLQDDDYPQSYVYLKDDDCLIELDSSDVESAIQREST